MSKSWYLSSSTSYLSGYENEEFSLNATSAFEEILLGSPESYPIKINTQDTIAIVQDKDAREVKTLLTRMDTVSRGDQITYKDHIYLVMDFVDDNKMHQTSEIKLCNTDIIVKSIPLSPTPIGYDKWKNPIYPDDYDPTPQEIPFSAIVEKSVVNEDTGAKIALDEDKVKVTISYIDLTINSFWVYGEKFDVYSKDLTKMMDNKGLLILYGERSNNDGTV